MKKLENRMKGRMSIGRRRRKMAGEIAENGKRFEYRPMFRVIVALAFFGVATVVMFLIPFEANEFFVPWFDKQATGLTVFGIITIIGVLMAVYGACEILTLLLKRRLTITGALLYSVMIFALCGFIVFCFRSGETKVSQSILLELVNSGNQGGN